MKVRELIAALSTHPPESEAVIYLPEWHSLRQPFNNFYSVECTQDGDEGKKETEIVVGELQP